MRKLINWLKANQPDEMKKSIQLKSIRLAWVYSVIFLLIWALYESYKSRQLNIGVNLVPCFLLMSQILVMIISRLIFRIRLAKGQYEEYEPSRKKIIITVIYIISVTIVATVVILAIPHMIVKLSA